MIQCDLYKYQANKGYEELKFNRGYSYKLITTGEQKQLLFNHIFNANQTWNILLNQKQNEYQSNLLIPEKSDKTYISFTEQDNLVKSILRQHKLKINTKVLQQTWMKFNSDFKKTIKSLGKDKVGMLKFTSSQDFNNQGYF